MCEPEDSTELTTKSPDEIYSPGAGVGTARSVVERIYDGFGGAEGFAQQLTEVIKRMSQRDPVPASLAPTMLKLLQLHHEIEKSDRQLDLQQMDNEQLEREHQLALMQYMAEVSEDPIKLDEMRRMFIQRGLLTDATALEVSDG